MIISAAIFALIYNLVLFLMWLKLEKLQAKEALMLAIEAQPFVWVISFLLAFCWRG